MTIYTDQVTGKKYDRMPGGVSGPAAPSAPSEDYLSCYNCAFHADFKQCGRAVKHCVSNTPNKTVFFVFKERKA